MKTIWEEFKSKKEVFDPRRDDPADAPRRPDSRPPLDPDQLRFVSHDLDKPEGDPNDPDYADEYVSGLSDKDIEMALRTLPSGDQSIMALAVRQEAGRRGITLPISNALR